MKLNEIRKKFLDFFDKRGHSIISSASLIPENDPSVLFNTAGMQPLVPYLLGEKHPAGNRIVDAQKCIRTTDIGEVGDKTHLTFFEMLGNWSLGDYFKKEAIKWSYEFLTDKKEGLGLDPKRLYVTVFGGNEYVHERDQESYDIWKEIFRKVELIPEEHIFFMEGLSNWWSPGSNGPCGADSEMFYDTTGELTKGLTKEEFIKVDDEQKIVEVWNDVFMEYEKKDGKIIGKLTQKNVDTGAGLERLAMVIQGKKSVYATDLLGDLHDAVRSKCTKISDFGHGADNDSVRIITDHIRAMVFIISDGVIPANTDRGYILRRIIRRAVRHADTLGIKEGRLSELANVVIEQYGDFYKNLKENAEQIKSEIQKEEAKFRKTLKTGLKQFEKISDSNISGFEAFVLFSSYGFPIEITEEIAKEKGLSVDLDGFKKEMKKHQELSRTASAGKFKGGLGGHDENSTKLHTATHLLHQALREVLGEHVEQKGSNITSERLRFDFSHSEKMTDEEKQKVENLINKKIKENLSIEKEEMSFEDAKQKGAIGLFESKYKEKVKVYSIGNFSKNEKTFSKEICGGPHTKNTKELGHFKIKKESASSAGIRRIKAILE